ncbi:MAG: ATP-binding cassette domain-containing protein [Bradymonadales bacterium]|nr:ATP-binding cassette domain-containing protein [Bradymonadales bacterium]
MTTQAVKTRRSYFAPEVVQSSAMDCGPASLKCLLAGYGIRVSYGRLREACQTDVDGTSIDTMEEVAVQLGLDAEQVMIPADHLLLPEARALPALVVVRLPNGVTHFLVVWRRHGNLLQVMDPGIGRRWIPARRLLDELYIHRMPVDAQDWRDWAGSKEHLGPLRRRLAHLQVPGHQVRKLIETAVADPGWLPIATLDAATRLVETIVRAGGLDPGRQATRMLQHLIAGSMAEGADQQDSTIPQVYWQVSPAPPAEDGSFQLLLRGAVLIRILGRRPGDPLQVQVAPGTGEQVGQPALSPDLVAALREAPSRPALELWRLLRADGLLGPIVLLVALALSSLGVLCEALLFRGFLDIGHDLATSTQRLVAILALILFLGALLLVEWPIRDILLRTGRHLESRLRVAFLRKIPRLGDRYFKSRLSSDMAERSHSVRHIRSLPDLGGQFVKACFDLTLTVVGITLLEPRSGPIAITVAIIAVAIPVMLQSPLKERDLRVRTHLGALSRFYLDALLGLFPIRCHGAEEAVKREHESLLVEWARSSISLQRMVVLAEGVQAMTGFALAAWLLMHHVGHQGQLGTVLLLVYWSLNLPILGQEIALAARQYPAMRNVTLRLMEPLSAPEEAVEDEPAIQPRPIPSPAGDYKAEQSRATARQERNRQTAVLAAGMVGPADGSGNKTIEGDGERTEIEEEDRTVRIEIPHATREDGPADSTGNDALDRRSEAEGTHPTAPPVRIQFQDVTVKAAGHLILEHIDLEIEAGSKVAIVGPSGAGKSSLVGVLLGWYRPASGRVLIDDQLLTDSRVHWLRRHTAWVDPSVQLWNRSFLENLLYGSKAATLPLLPSAISTANLRGVLERLPDGLQTRLGESGALVSGGEGQRIRLGRSLLRPGVKLAILDEPFRGLDRAQRRELLTRAQRWWADATLLCITHDVGETRGFERVVVIEGGRLAEEGEPHLLAERPDSHYRQMLLAEQEVRKRLWSGTDWRKLWLEKGKLAAEHDGGLP